MSKTTNFYEVLNVKENVSQDEIKKAYRQLSLQYHPDRNQNSLESTNKFQNINAAYEVIGDEQKRRQYDMQRKHQHSGNFPFPFQHHHQSQHTENSHGPTFFSTGPIDIDPTEIFNFFSNNLFSNGGNRGAGGGGPHMFSMENLKQKLAKPTPIIINETITLNKAYTGFNMPIEITRWIIENDVKREETETIYLPIPKGIDNNEMIIIRDKGNMINETNKGDIKIFIKITNDTDFERNGLDLSLHKTITLKEALCGFTLEMKFLDGRIFKINNVAGNIITHNYNKVLNGLGMKRDDHVGNLIIHFNVIFPEQLTEQQIQGLNTIL